MSLSFFSGKSEMTSLSDLIRELFSRVPQWLEAQLALTKAEIRTESQKMLSVVVWGLVAVTFAYITVLFAGVSLLLLLAEPLGWAGAAGTTAAAFLLLTGIAAAWMFREIRKKADAIEVTVES